MVAKIENDVQALSDKELAEFRKWFSEFDRAAWNGQLEQDIRAGRLDALADEALADHAAHKTTAL